MKKKMSIAGQKALLELEKTMVVSHLANRSIVAYSREVRFMIDYYPDIDPMDWTESLVIDYLHHLITQSNASRSKCHMAAQSMAYFFRHVLNKPFHTPGKIYPKRDFKLPTVLTREEVQRLLKACNSLKEKAILELFYSTGMRLSEAQHLKMIHIEAHENRIKVVCGKGSRQRYTLLSKRCLNTLREYYLKTPIKPQTYLFEGQEPGKPMHARSIQHAMVMVYQRAGLQDKPKKSACPATQFCYSSAR